ncbi:hypothetical protein K435DRAFT_775184 [Dendrothele bispora CBS 962.96]|uniref:EKC/KEOPS complex subunit GON7 n=1 Tax=Dendrothele bispora (strain CBS 962.96) TaxID=1314807 RepID=A0A4S8MJS8_DENBC|nr:hypothetical protein K435DRAFT_775184 [Dendrothele bispora CBS 962.96]
MSKSITITYSLKPPSETKAVDGAVPSKTIEVPVSPQTENYEVYYGKLHDAIEDARNKIGEDLTVWRDAVGKGELGKETKKTLNETEEEEEEEEEE